MKQNHNVTDKQRSGSVLPPLFPLNWAVMTQKQDCDCLEIQPLYSI